MNSPVDDIKSLHVLEPLLSQFQSFTCFSCGDRFGDVSHGWRTKSLMRRDSIM